MQLPVNPYIAGNPVGDGPAFIGRADVLREVTRVLRHPQNNAIVLYGQRRIGKTSILQYLETHLPTEGPYRAVYFDLQDKAEWFLGRVLHILAQTIAQALNQPEPDLGQDAATAFRQTWLPAALDALPAGCSLVLLFDEFDVLSDPQGGQAAKAFFPYLRDLLGVDPTRLQFVFVIGRNVGDLNAIALSLFKGTPYRRVSLLDEADVAALARLSETNGTLRWPDDAVGAVWALTHGHPFLTQMLCSHVWETLIYDADADNAPTVTPEDVEAAIPDGLQASENALEWLWNGLGPAERVVASALAETGPSPITREMLEQVLQESGVRVLIRELQNAPELLQGWDIIEPNDGGYRFRVELLRRWIAERKPLRRVQEDLDRIQPAADSLYRAAWSIYNGGQFDQAIPLLRQSIGFNPNHVGANQLLADIYLTQGKFEDSYKILKRLHEYQPNAARPRLVQTLLAKLDLAKNSSNKLRICDEILELQPSLPEVVRIKRDILIHVGDEALKLNHFEEALQAYVQAEAVERIKSVHHAINVRNEYNSSSVWRIYQEALQIVLANQTEIDDAQSAENSTILQTVKQQLYYAQQYEYGKNLLEQNQLKKAIQVFQKLIAHYPTYRDATLLLAIAVQRSKSQTDIISTTEQQAQRIRKLQQEIEKKNEKIQQVSQLASQATHLQETLYKYEQELKLHRRQETLLVTLIRLIFRINAPIDQLPVSRSEEITNPDLAGSPSSIRTYTYVLGDDYFDPSFSIEMGADFYGECGIGISESLGAGDPKKVTAFEVWLFDKSDIRTVTTVLASEYSYHDPDLNEKFQPKRDGDNLQIIKDGLEITHDTTALRVKVRIRELNYAENDKFPSKSYFSKVTFELRAWVKELE